MLDKKRTNDYFWSDIYFFISKIKDPFLGKKNVPKRGVVALFMRDYCASIYRKGIELKSMELKTADQTQSFVPRFPKR